MTVSIIVIGDELLIGQVVDTNSGEIARHIAPMGWEVNYVQTVGDNADDIMRAIDRAFTLSDIVLTTGGLGPTKDDITKGVLCHYFGGELKEDPSVLRNVEEVMARRGRDLNVLTRTQAIVPTSCRVIQNRVGTAPIMWFDRCEGDRRMVLVAMPGVPFETREMFQSEVFPQLLECFGNGDDVEHRTVIAYGISESALAERLAEWESSLPPYLHLAYLPKDGLVRLRLDGHLPDAEALRSAIDLRHEQLASLVGQYLIATVDLTPEQLLLNRLHDTGMTVATAESCTGGNIAHLITSIPGSSESMLGGVVAYSNSVKMTLLGVRPATLDAYGAVSEPTVKEMAEGVCRVTGAKVGIATSGIAGPGGGTPEKPVGTVCIGVATPDGTITVTRHFAGSRLRVIDQSSVAAIIMALSRI